MESAKAGAVAGEGKAVTSERFGSAIPIFDERFARQYRYDPPPEFLLASTYTSIVRLLSGPNS